MDVCGPACFISIVSVSKATTNRPKNRIPIDALPSNLDEWSTYEVPDEVFQAFNHPVMASSTGITNQTIQKPVDISLLI